MVGVSYEKEEEGNFRRKQLQTCQKLVAIQSPKK